jgi:UDP-2,3-diacylglucosamine hydrolase
MQASDSQAVPLPDEVMRLDLSHCDQIAFLSDVHLEVNHRSTYQAWAGYLQSLQADALFILGDLFEVWLGDDILQHPSADFERTCLAHIYAVSQRMPVYWMVGNRDFLLDAQACTTAGMTPLTDPCVVTVFEQHWLLSHGDVLCLDDKAYQAYRREIRSNEWMQRLKSTSLNDRMLLAKELQAQSQLSKLQNTLWADVDDHAASQWLETTQTEVLIHGHTHRPQDHQLGPLHRRIVLSDWDADANPQRLQSMLWTSKQGFTRQSLSQPNINVAKAP